MKLNALAVMSLLLLVPNPLHIGDFERGNRMFRAGRYAEAVAAYRRALADGRNTPELHYNLGTALLLQKQYAEAEKELRTALTAVDPELRQRTYYNIGNRYLEEARASKTKEPQTEKLNAAIDAYKQALRLRPSDMDAKWNLELALREQEKQPPQSGGGGGGNEDKQDQDQKNQAQNGGSGNNNAQAQNNPGSANPQRRPMSPQDADRILSSAEQDERQLYKERLRKGQREMPVLRDW